MLGSRLVLRLFFLVPGPRKVRIPEQGGDCDAAYMRTYKALSMRVIVMTCKFPWNFRVRMFRMAQSKHSKPKTTGTRIPAWIPP